MSSYYQNLLERRDSLKEQLEETCEEDTYTANEILDELLELEEQISDAEDDDADMY